MNMDAFKHKKKREKKWKSYFQFGTVEEKKRYSKRGRKKHNVAFELWSCVCVIWVLFGTMLTFTWSRIRIAIMRYFPRFHSNYVHKHIVSCDIKTGLSSSHASCLLNRIYQLTELTQLHKISVSPFWIGIIEQFFLRSLAMTVAFGLFYGIEKTVSRIFNLKLCRSEHFCWIQA